MLPSEPSIGCVFRQVATGGYRIDKPSDHPSHLGVDNPSFPSIRLCSHKTEAVIKAFSGSPLETYSGMPLTRFAFSVPASLEFSQDHRLDIYTGAIHIAPPMDTRHWFDQPILAPYDDYVLDADAFAIDTATNQSLPILGFSAADPTDNFYADNQVDWDTESTFNGQRVPSKHFQMRVKGSFLSRIFTIVLLIVNWLLTAGCLRIILVSVVGHEELGESTLLLPITIILTVPALRQLYVGSPPFGEYLTTPTEFPVLIGLHRHLDR